MKYRITIDPQAATDLAGIQVYNRREILEGIEEILLTQPTHVTRSRIKRLRGIDSPPFGYASASIVSSTT